MKSMSIALLSFLVTAALANDADDLIAKHVTARGGDNWKQIETMKISGTFAAFSITSPFVIHKKRPNMYHIDQKMNQKTVIIGHDGEVTWWENHWMSPGAQPVDGLNLQVIQRDTSFVSRLFHYQEEGFSARMAEATEVDGIPCVAVEITKGEETETWYLDPTTYLEIACDSAGSDFGNPVPQRTFFDDFREIQGVKVPFYVEAQFYTRDRVMHVDSVEFNVDVDANLFSMPLPPGMAPLKHLVGSFHVKVETRSQPGANPENSETQSSIEAQLGHGLLQERFQTAEGDDVLRSFSYDAFAKTYRITEIDSDRNHLAVMEGNFDDAGQLSASTMETKTTWETFGYTVHTRLNVKDISETGFTIETDLSIDDGENWFTAVKAEYQRKPES